MARFGEVVEDRAKMRRLIQKCKLMGQKIAPTINGILQRRFGTKTWNAIVIGLATLESKIDDQNMVLEKLITDKLDGKTNITVLKYDNDGMTRTDIVAKQ